MNKFILLFVILFLIVITTYAEETDIFQAIENGDVKKVEKFLQDPSTLELIDDYGFDPLFHLISYNNQVEMSSLMTRSIMVSDDDIPDIDEPSKEFHNNKFKIVDLLIKAGYDINLSTEGFGMTPLMYAAFTKSEELIDYFLEIGADINAQTKEGATVLFWAAGFCEASTLKKLQKEGAIFQATNLDISPLLSAVYLNNIETVKFLFEAYPEADFHIADSSGENLLFSAAKNKDAEVMEFLINKGLNVNKNNKYGENPLMLAVQYNDAEVVKLLINAGADVNISSDMSVSPLTLSANTGKLETMKLLVEAGADIHHRGFMDNTPLMQAIGNDSVECVKYLIEIGADINQLNSIDTSPLNAALYDEDIESFKVLLDAGADINILNDSGERLMLYAIYNELEEFVSLLVKYGKENNVFEDIKHDILKTALFKEGNLSIVNSILSLGIDINQPLLFGATPILYAAEYSKNPEIIVLLISKGADVNKVDYQEKNALYYAEKNPFLIGTIACELLEELTYNKI